MEANRSNKQNKFDFQKASLWRRLSTLTKNRSDLPGCIRPEKKQEPRSCKWSFIPLRAWICPVSSFQSLCLSCPRPRWLQLFPKELCGWLAVPVSARHRVGFQ